MVRSVHVPGRGLVPAGSVGTGPPGSGTVYLLRPALVTWRGGDEERKIGSDPDENCQAEGVVGTTGYVGSGGAEWFALGMRRMGKMKKRRRGDKKNRSRRIQALFIAFRPGGRRLASVAWWEETDQCCQGKRG